MAQGLTLRGQSPIITRGISSNLQPTSGSSFEEKLMLFRLFDEHDNKTKFPTSAEQQSTSALENSVSNESKFSKINKIYSFQINFYFKLHF